MNEKDILDFEKSEEKSRAGVSIPLVACSGFLVVLGFLFKLMHWPGAGIMILLGSGVLCGHLIYQFTLLKKRKTTDYLLALLPLAWVVFLFLQFRYGVTAAGLFILSGMVTIIINSVLVKNR